MKSKSFVVVEISTGKGVFEFYNEALVKGVNKEKYRVIPIYEYLQSLNRMPKIALVAESFDRNIAIYELADQNFRVERDNKPLGVHTTLKDAIGSLPAENFCSVSFSERINRFYDHSIKTNERIFKVLTFDNETYLCNVEHLCLSDLASIKKVSHYWNFDFQPFDKATLKEMILLRYREVLDRSGKTSK